MSSTLRAFSFAFHWFLTEYPVKRQIDLDLVGTGLNLDVDFDWTGFPWNGLDWTWPGLDWTGLDKTKLDLGLWLWLGLKIKLDLTWLESTSLGFELNRLNSVVWTEWIRLNWPARANETWPLWPGLIRFMTGKFTRRRNLRHWRTDICNEMELWPLARRIVEWWLRWLVIDWVFPKLLIDWPVCMAAAAAVDRLGLQRNLSVHIRCQRSSHL